MHYIKVKDIIATKWFAVKKHNGEIRIFYSAEDLPNMIIRDFTEVESDEENVVITGYSIIHGGHEKVRVTFPKNRWGKNEFFNENIASEELSPEIDYSEFIVDENYED